MAVMLATPGPRFFLSYRSENVVVQLSHELQWNDQKIAGSIVKGQPIDQGLESQNLLTKHLLHKKF